MYQPHYDADRWTLFFVDGPLVDKDCFAGERNVFVCGGLQHPDKMAWVSGRNAPFAPAVAIGYRRTWKQVDGKAISFMVPDLDDPRRVLTGVVWLDLSPADIERIEAFELGGGLRQRVEIDVLVGDAVVRAITYVEK
ncbi:gamma-glutamylcyclotransferase family protein [Planctomycetota bacterium]